MADRFTHTGTVVSISGGLATVRLKEDASCDGCTSCATDGDALLAPAIDDTGVRPGDLVVLAAPVRAATIGAALLFGVPLAGIAIGAVVGDAIASPLLGAVGGFILGILPLTVYRIYCHRNPGYLRIERLAPTSR